MITSQQLAVLFYSKLTILSLITGTVQPSVTFIITIWTQYDNFNMPYNSVSYRNFVALWYPYIELLTTTSRTQNSLCSSFLTFLVAYLHSDFRCLIHAFSEFSFVSVRLDTWSSGLQQVMITLLEINTLCFFGVGANLRHNGFSGGWCSDLWTKNCKYWDW